LGLAGRKIRRPLRLPMVEVITLSFSLRCAVKARRAAHLFSSPDN
jgi:hypothetical protein